MYFTHSLARGFVRERAFITSEKVKFFQLLSCCYTLFLYTSVCNASFLNLSFSLEISGIISDSQICGITQMVRVPSVRKFKQAVILYFR